MWICSALTPFHPKMERDWSRFEVPAQAGTTGYPYLIRDSPDSMASILYKGIAAVPNLRFMPGIIVLLPPATVPNQFKDLYAVQQTNGPTVLDQGNYLIACFVHAFQRIENGGFRVNGREARQGRH